MSPRLRRALSRTSPRPGMVVAAFTLGKLSSAGTVRRVALSHRLYLDTTRPYLGWSKIDYDPGTGVRVVPAPAWVWRLLASNRTENPMRDRFTFHAPLPPEKVAVILARVVAQSFGPACDVFPGVPFLAEGGRWWELSTAHSHKLDILGDGRYAYRDRNHPPERMAFVREAVVARGWTVEEES